MISDEERRKLEALVAQAGHELAEANAPLAPGESSRLVADLAHRLVQHGQLEKISLAIRGTRQAAETVLSFLAERLQANAPEAMPDPLHALSAPGKGDLGRLASVQSVTRGILKPTPDPLGNAL